MDGFHAPFGLFQPESSCPIHPMESGIDVPEEETNEGKVWLVDQAEPAEAAITDATKTGNSAASSKCESVKHQSRQGPGVLQTNEITTAKRRESVHGSGAEEVEAGAEGQGFVAKTVSKESKQEAKQRTASAHTSSKGDHITDGASPTSSHRHSSSHSHRHRRHRSGEDRIKHEERGASHTRVDPQRHRSHNSVSHNEDQDLPHDHRRPHRHGQSIQSTRPHHEIRNSQRRKMAENEHHKDGHQTPLALRIALAISDSMRGESSHRPRHSSMPPVHRKPHQPHDYRHGFDEHTLSAFVHSATHGHHQHKHRPPLHG